MGTEGTGIIIEKNGKEFVVEALGRFGALELSSI